MIRPTLHAAAGLAALSLRFLDLTGAVVLAVLLIVHNAALLPRYAPGLMRPPGPRADAGVALYPVVVLAAILALPDRPELAAAVWAVLAYGDAAAALVGTRCGGPRWPWNRGKSVPGSVAFALAGAAGAVATAAFVAARAGGLPVASGGAIVAGAVVAALVESAPSRLNDNVRIGAATIGVLAAWRLVDPGLVGTAGDRLASRGLPAILVSLAGGFLAWRSGSVGRSGLAAGVPIAAVVWVGLGASGFAALAAFVATGSLATRYGRERKERLGAAQARQGRRRWTHVLANGGVAGALAALSTVSPQSAALRLAALAALATAAFDTVATEIGPVRAARAWRWPPGESVPAGTPGAISLPGTVAGAGAAAIVAALGAGLGPEGIRAVGPILLAATAGTTLESLLGAVPATRGTLGGHARNLVGTAAGAALAALLGG